MVCMVLVLVFSGQMEYASKQLLCAVHMRGGPQASCGGLLVSLDEMTGRYWADSAAGETRVVLADTANGAVSVTGLCLSHGSTAQRMHFGCLSVLNCKPLWQAAHAALRGLSLAYLGAYFAGECYECLRYCFVLQAAAC